MAEPLPIGGPQNAAIDVPFNILVTARRRELGRFWWALAWNRRRRQADRHAAISGIGLISSCAFSYFVKKEDESTTVIKAGVSHRSGTESSP